MQNSCPANLPQSNLPETGLNSLETLAECTPRTPEVFDNEKILALQQGVIEKVISNLYAYKLINGGQLSDEYDVFVNNDFTQKYNPLVVHLKRDSKVYFQEEAWPEKAMEEFKGVGLESRISPVYKKIHSIIQSNGQRYSLNNAGEIVTSRIV